MKLQHERIVSFLYSTGLPALVWSTPVLFPYALKSGIAWIVFVVGLLMAGGAIVLWLKGGPKPKKDVLDALYLATQAGDRIAREPVNGIPDEVFFEKNSKKWIEETEALLLKHVNDEEVHMFSTVSPMLRNLGDDVDQLREAVHRRVDKLRRITGRYFRCENHR